MQNRIVVSIAIFSLILMMLTAMTNLNADPGTVVHMAPAAISDAVVGQDYTVDINVSNVADLYAWEFQLSYDQTILHLTSASIVAGGLNTPTQTYQSVTDDANGHLWWAVSTTHPTATGITYAEHAIFEIVFHAIATGTCNLHLSGTILSDHTGAAISHTDADGTIYVQNLTLTITTDGNGTVTLNETGPYYYFDEAIQLNANPAVGWSFQYWTGDLSGSANVTTIIMTANFSVTAHFINKPTLQMSPASKTCRMYHENFTVTITVSSVADFADFTFEIDYNTTLLDYVSVTWGIWGSGSASITVDEANGKITVSNSGTAISGTQTLVTINFTVSLHHIFKYGTTENPWTNDLIDTIYFQSINISYPTGSDLQYQRGDSTQISVGQDFAYTFSPIQGDVDNNGIVDIFDLRTVAAYFGTSNPTYDLNNDGPIDVADIQIVAYNFDFTYHP